MMKGNYQDTGWAYQLVASGLMSLVPGALFGVYAGLRESAEHGLIVGLIAFLVAWVCLMFAARTSVQRSKARNFH